MSEVGFALAVGCVLQIAETRVEPAADGWRESTRLEVAASPSCDAIELTLPAGALLGEHVAKQKLGDGTGARLGEERWEQLPRAIDGSGRVKLHTPELLGGDRVFVTFERLLPPGPFTWRPGSARYVEVELDGDGTLEAPGAAEGRVWKSDPGPEWVATFTPSTGSEGGSTAGSGPPAEEDGPRLPAGDVRIERRLVLHVPPGDPLMSLYPGGGSTVTVEDHLGFGPSELERVWPLDAPAGARIELRSEPDGVARLEQDRASARVVIGASEGPTRVTVRWDQPDAPTFGGRGDLEALTVEIADGEVRWEGDAWYLQRVRDRVILPSREALVRGLDRRFREMAIPEPGAPLELRGGSPGWELAAKLRPVLLERVAIGEWPADPLFPRKLIKARKTAALTPLEAALTTWLYARQIRLEADWVLVRPAPLGPAPETAPVGYEAALVRIRHEGETRWIDPTCSVCAPFELPPALEGASALGPGAPPTTPPPSPGRHEVTVSDDQVVWKLEGSAALALRLWLQQLPTDRRAAALAQRVGGPGAKLLWTQGLDQAGGEILLQASRGAGLLEDPLALPPADPEGGAWVDWVGERTLLRPDRDLPDLQVDQGPLHYSRRREEGRLVERLVIDERKLDAAAMAAVEAARGGPAGADPALEDAAAPQPTGSEPSRSDPSRSEPTGPEPAPAAPAPPPGPAPTPAVPAPQPAEPAPKPGPY